MARPTKLTPETHAAIEKALKIGSTRKDAAGAAGVDYQTFLNWMAAGETGKSGALFEFFVACTKAEHVARLNYLNTIAKAAQDGDWRAALEYLKRRDPDNWGDKQSVALQNPDGTNLQLTVVEKTDAQLSDTLSQLAAIAGRLAQASGAGVPRDAGGPAGSDTSGEAG